MFGFKSKKSKTELFYAPVQGRIMDISDTPDTVFSEKMVGDGVTIDATEAVIVAPCDGEVAVVPKSRHAVALKTAAGVEILVHAGLDTVELEGRGFTAHVQAGDIVKRGDSLLSLDRDYIISQGKSLITPVVITNMAEKVHSIKKYFDRSDGVIMEVEVKG